MEKLNQLFTSLHDFLLISLPKERKCSENTIRSYKKTLEMLLDFVKEKTDKPYNEISFEDIDRNMVSDFLDYLENERTRSVFVEDSGKNGGALGVAAAHRVATSQLLQVTGDPETAARIRKEGLGRIAAIGLFYSGNKRGVNNLSQILLTEISH